MSSLETVVVVVPRILHLHVYTMYLILVLPQNPESDQPCQFDRFCSEIHSMNA